MEENQEIERESLEEKMEDQHIYDSRMYTRYQFRNFIGSNKSKARKRRGIPFSNTPSPIVSGYKKVKRNEKCACGSGRKSKKCCVA